MGRGSVSSKFLLILNIIYTLLGVALVGLSICSYLALDTLTSLRNKNNFPRFEMVPVLIIPWVLVAAGMFAILVSSCAFLGVFKKSRPLVWTNVVFQIFAIVILAGAAFGSFKYMDSKETDVFIDTAVTDSFSYQSVTGEGFHSMEVSLQCCGVSGASSYASDKWPAYYPSSCCKNHANHPVQVCLRSDVGANSRKGCVEIATTYTRLAAKVLGMFAVLVMFVAVLNLVCALILTSGLNNRKRMKVKLESQTDTETHISHVSTVDLATLKLPHKV